MKFNESHHTAGKSVTAHQHNTLHHEEENASGTHKHDSSHQHDHATKDHHQSEKTEDNCCTDEVIEFAQIDKRAPQFSDFSFQPVILVVFLKGIHNFNVYASVKLISHSKYFVRSYHPPIPEIRIAIQSFQI